MLTYADVCRFTTQQLEESWALGFKGQDPLVWPPLVLYYSNAPHSKVHVLKSVLPLLGLKLLVYEAFSY